MNKRRNPYKILLVMIIVGYIITIEMVGLASNLELLGPVET